MICGVGVMLVLIAVRRKISNPRVFAGILLLGALLLAWGNAISMVHENHFYAKIEGVTVGVIALCLGALIFGYPIGLRKGDPRPMSHRVCTIIACAVGAAHGIALLLNKPYVQAVYDFYKSIGI